MSDLFNLNLETGEASETKPQGSSGEGEKRTRRKRTSATAKIETELTNRLERLTNRLAESLEGRQDYELSAALREDAKAMTGSVVSLTTRFPPLRTPLLFVLGLAEPLVAFWRIARILLGRVAERRSSETEIVDNGNGPTMAPPAE